MLLTIDIGNTTIFIGMYKGANLAANFSLNTARKTEDEYGIEILELIKYVNIDLEITGCIISCVVPTLTPIFKKLVEKYFKISPVFVDPLKVSMPIRCSNPKEIGQDRIVNAIAAYKIYGGPNIVIDFGTATTFDVVSKEGEYLGGAIAPGIGISIEALSRHTARLPKVELVKPGSIIGKNTVEALQVGIYYGFVGQVDEIVRRIKEEFTEEVKVIATGGLAEFISDGSKYIEIVNSVLILEGLRIIYEDLKGGG
ncbi:MAG: type III pantothenate kinase [bacterium]|nr:type III pantothenate kinase [bacterium]